MERPKILRRLRITASAVFAVFCVLLVALSIRSYWRYDWLGGLTLTPRNNGFDVKDGCLIESANGVLVVLYAGNVRESVLLIGQSVGHSMASRTLRVTGDNGESAWNGFQAQGYPSGIFRGSAPHWSLALIFGALAAAFGIRHAPYQFSLRTLLIVTALVAVVLGVIAGR